MQNSLPYLQGRVPRNDSTYNKVYQKALGIFDAIHKNVEKNSEMAELALTADDAYRLEKRGKIAALSGWKMVTRSVRIFQRSGNFTTWEPGI